MQLFQLVFFVPQIGFNMKSFGFKCGVKKALINPYKFIIAWKYLFRTIFIKYLNILESFYHASFSEKIVFPANVDPSRANQHLH